MITARVVDNRELGHLVLVATPTVGDPVDITVFRGIPTQIESFSTEDPFGDAQLSFSLPSVTIYDRPGTGDLAWLRPFSKVEAYWKLAPGISGTALGRVLASWRWSGFVASWDQTQDESTSSTSVECFGALHILNNILAIPYADATQPYPVEMVINDLVTRAKSVGLRLGSLTVKHHPEDYALAAASSQADALTDPKGIVKGQRWSGVATRSVGSMTTKAGDFIRTTLLPMMYTPGGRQYTMVNSGSGYDSTLMVKPDLSVDTALRIDLTTPGVTFGFSKDYTTAANSIYTTGKDIDGTPYSSLGRDTPANYRLPNGNLGAIANRLKFNGATPFASLPSVLSEDTILNEQALTISDGMSLSDALEVSRKKLLQNADPGYAGTLTLSSDPSTPDGDTFPRYCIKAGMSIEVSGISNSSILFYVSSATVSLDTGKVSLVVDTKSRNADTLEEMRARARDPLDTIRSVNVSKAQYNYQNDILLAWNNDKSGVIPYDTGVTETMFREIESGSIPFPWTPVTTKYPPSRYESSYVKIAAPNYVDVRKCYAVTTVRLASYADIRLLQMAAYDRSGNVLPVEFHVSFYQNPRADYLVMPRVFQDTLKAGSKSFLESPWRQRTTVQRMVQPFRIYGFRDWAEVKKGKKDKQRFCYVIVDAACPIVPPDTYVEIQSVNLAVNSSASATSATAVTQVIAQPSGFSKRDDIILAKDKKALGIPDSFNVAGKRLVWLVSRSAVPDAEASSFTSGPDASIRCVAADYDPASKNYTRYRQTRGWPISTPYPFFETAWTDRYPDGSYIDPVVGSGTNTQWLRPKAESGFLNGWGTYYNPAGYWPATQVIKNVTPRTGMLQDESTWSVDLTKSTYTRWDTRNPKSYVPAPTDKPGIVTVIVFCEEGEAYFLGRLKHKPQGT